MAWANDDLANATALSGSSGAITPLTYDSTVDPATSEIGEVVSGSGETLWWKWTAPSNGNFMFATVGSPSASDPDGLDTIMHVFSGPSTAPTHAALTLVGNNDDNAAHDTYILNSRVIFTATAGTTYYVQVDQYSSGQAGTLHLSWAEVIPPPPPVFTWTTVATDTFDRPDSATDINPSSDGGTWTVIRGTAGISSGQGYFPVMSSDFDDGLVYRDVGSDIQDVSIDNYRSDVGGQSSLSLSWNGTPGPAYILSFDSSAAATIHGLSSSEAVTLTPWTGGTTRLRMVAYYGDDGIEHVKIYQDGVQVHEFIESGGLAGGPGIAFGSEGHSFHTFDDLFDNLVVLTGVRRAASGWQVGSVALT